MEFELTLYEQYRMGKKFDKNELSFKRQKYLAEMSELVEVLKERELTADEERRYLSLSAREKDISKIFRDMAEKAAATWKSN